MTNSTSTQKTSSTSKGSKMVRFVAAAAGVAGLALAVAPAAGASTLTEDYVMVSHTTRQLVKDTNEGLDRLNCGGSTVDCSVVGDFVLRLV